ncbi:MAG: SsrA-binding protein SmpB [Rickettsiales bacterium]
MSEQERPRKIIADNRRARFEYEILDVFECGIVLQGSEVKSMRLGKANVGDAFADVDRFGAVMLYQMHVSEYKGATRWNHDPRRPRKLLMHKSEIRKLTGKVKEKGLTLVPLSVYFNHKNMVKIEIALAKGKKTHDKRETIKQREWERQKHRTLKRGE